MRPSIALFLYLSLSSLFALVPEDGKNPYEEKEPQIIELQRYLQKEAGVNEVEDYMGVAPIRSLLYTEYQHELNQAKRNYRRRLAHVLSTHSDQIIVFKLENEVVREDERVKDTLYFDLLPYGKYAPIVDFKLHNKGDDSFYDIADGLDSFLDSGLDEMGAMCHQPAYGVQAYYTGHLLFETSICFKCSNYSMTYGSGHEWEGIADHTFKEVLQAVFEETTPATEESQP